jgi:epoxyqueuosine reductase
MEPEVSFEELQAKALALGWDDVGVTAARISLEDTQAYKDWLANGYQADLSYMENEIRCDPEKLFPGVKTAIILVSYYKQEQLPFQKGKGVVASYARGRDYHNMHRRRLKKLIGWLEEKSGKQGIARGFSDSFPILEKALAVQAGLGWFGKNTLLIHRRFGTFTLLSGVLTTLEFSNPVLAARLPRCGSCTKCMDACPTQALVSPYKLDAARCLSYHLIESKKEIPEEIAQKNPGFVFGCDICQNVCPHNQRTKLSECSDFGAENGFGGYLDLEILNAVESHPEVLYGTPLQRRGVEGLKYSLERLRIFEIESGGDAKSTEEV